MYPEFIHFDAAVDANTYDRTELPHVEALAALHLGIGLMLTTRNPLVRADFAQDNELRWPDLNKELGEGQLRDLEPSADRRMRSFGRIWEEGGDRFLGLQRDLYGEMMGGSGNSSRDAAATFCLLGLYHPSPIVHVAAAAATLSFCRNYSYPIGLAFRRLMEARHNRENPIAAEIAWTALGNALRGGGNEGGSNPSAMPPQEIPQGLEGGRPQTEKTAVIVHGTIFAKHLSQVEEWWRPADPSGANEGDLHKYLREGPRPGVYDRQDYYRWSGGWNDYAREEAAEKLVHWIDARRIASPDVFAHSHGCNVAMIASHARAFDRLVLMSCPVWPEYRPSTQVGRAISVRIKWDLVIMADGAAQRCPSDWGVTEEVLPIWYSKHDVTRRSDTWRTLNLDKLL